jgi:hypothetical protein
MSEMDFETQVRSIARTLRYPPTPDVAGSVMPRLRPVTGPRLFSRPWAWSLVTVLILLSSLLLIPPARAAILEFIQIGIVRIFPRATELPVEAPPTEMPQPLAPVTATPYMNAAPLLDDLGRFAGERTLPEAQSLASSSYPIRLPAYPTDLGAPDRVFVQQADGVIVIMVWLDPGQPDRMLMSLHSIPTGSWMIRKFEPRVIEKTRVNNQPAVWAVGPYPILLSNGESDYVRLIDGHVLIWEMGEITYRLESNLSLEEAIKVAESLQPIP